VDDATQYWFNVRTGEVDQGHRRPGADLLGPYATREEAQNALEKARQRTEAWDREDADDA
jgi:hypothetical protein